MPAASEKALPQLPLSARKLHCPQSDISLAGVPPDFFRFQIILLFPNHSPPVTISIYYSIYSRQEMILFFIRFLTIKKGIIFDSGSKSVGKTYIILRKIVSYTYFETCVSLGYFIKRKKRKNERRRKNFCRKNV